MCGIVCYIGPKSCSNIIMDALKCLEYRGYDSAGIAIHEKDQISVVRAEGKLSNLASALSDTPLSGTVGIGHTRWATHGKPSETNAHPHIVDGIAVVHNGILENHLELKRELVAKGSVFSSETDTEILAHLIARAFRRTGNLLEALRESLQKVQGSYAVAVLSEDEPNKILVAKNASPLVIGIGEGEMFAASDVPAILEHTRDVIFMDEGEIATIDPTGAKIEDLAGTQINREPTRITWSPMQAQKRGYKHFMLKEIFEQPRVVEDTIRGRVSTETGEVASELIGIDNTSAKRIRRVVLVACGTSFHAALVGRYWIESLAGIPAEVELASEYRARNPLVDPNDLVIGVSQSGETLDTLEAIKVAKAGAAQVLAIANVLGSAIPRAADGALYTHAGPEIGVASTKCFTAQLTALFMLAIFLGRRRGTLDKEKAQELLKWLLEVPSLMRKVLKVNDQVAAISKKYAGAKNFLFLGRSLSFPIALEGALKLKEISYIHAEGYAAGEMKHGPIALIDEQMPVVVVMPNDSSFDRIQGNVQEVMARGGQVIAVSTENAAAAKELGIVNIEIPACPEELSPLITIIPLQLLSYHVADFKGTDVDQPRNLAKTVTVE